MKNPIFAQHDSPRPHGFTLIELLVTVSIILVLAALSMAGYIKLRKSAYQVVTLRNVTQLQIANATYAADHNGKYVPRWTSDSDGGAVQGSPYWFANQEYLVNLRGASKDQWDQNVPEGLLDPIAIQANKRRNPGQSNSLFGSFGYNTDGATDGQSTESGGGWMGKNQHVSYYVHQVTYPSRSAVFITCSDWLVGYGSRFKWKADSTDGGAIPKQVMAYRYNNKAIVVFYDAHAAAVSMADMEAIDKNGRGAKNPFWNASAPP